MKSTRRLLGIIGLAGWAAAQAGAQVPPLYQAAYTDVNNHIQAFDQTVKGLWNGVPSPVMYSAQLQTVNSDLTTSLLAPNYYPVTVLSELDTLTALGVKAITFHINFPAMYQPFYGNQADYQAYLNFYTTLVNDIRARGMKVIIENTIAIVYPGNNSQSFVPYYQSLDWPTYQAQRAQLAANIAELFHPDYLVMVAEPGTEAFATGQVNAGTVSGSTQMLGGMITAVGAAGVTGVKLGAGCGSWDPAYLQYIQSFVTLPLDFIDMHIYPVNNNTLPNAMAGLTITQNAGKPATMSEMWPYKETDAEFTQNLSYVTVYARDAFSFWSTTDQAFLQTMSDFANYGNFTFITPFWSHYFGAYLDYGVYGALPDATVITDSDTAATAANIAGTYTSTARAWEKIVNPSPDTTPPLVPAAPALKSISQTNSNILWSPTSDNVGVTGYYVYRNQRKLATVVSPLAYSDSKLTPNTTYLYTLTAFDAAGNVSPMSSPLTATTLSYPDKTPPSVPQGTAAIAFTDQQIDLTWQPSVDNVGVVGYEVYRGTVANNITPLAVIPVNGYLVLTGNPSTTYYFQVDAYDASGNHSARSPVFSATTLADTTPPTSPTNIVGTPGLGPSVAVTWGAATDDYRVASYQILRGTTPTSLSLMGGVAATALTWKDVTVKSGKTYYYSVTAKDVAGNVSAMPAPVMVVIP